LALDAVPPPPQDRHLRPQGVPSAEARRRRIGIEAARIILGHRSAAITEVYAELGQGKAINAMLKYG